MIPESFILDTSAILTLIEGEDGEERVEQVLRKEAVLLPWLVLLEVRYVSFRERGKPEADRRYALLKQFPVNILWGNRRGHSIGCLGAQGITPHFAGRCAYCRFCYSA